MDFGCLDFFNLLVNVCKGFKICNGMVFNGLLGCIGGFTEILGLLRLCPLVCFFYTEIA